MNRKKTPVIFWLGWILILVHICPVMGHEASSESVQIGETPIMLRVPLSSEVFADTPVAMVNEEAITVNDLLTALSQQEEELQLAGKENVIERVLNRLVTSRLLVLEALNIGLDEVDTFRFQVDEYKAKLLQKELVEKQLQGLEPDDKDVDDVYRQLSREVLLSSLVFTSGQDAQSFYDEAQEGDYSALARKYIEEGKAVEEKNDQYVKVKDLKPQVGKQVYDMKVGDISRVYRTEEGFLVFHLLDTRFVEDPEVKKEAEKIVVKTLRKQKAMEYGNKLADKYTTFDEDLYKQLDFDKDFDKLLKDKRVLVVIKGGDEPTIITVADLAANMQLKFFHGIDKAQQLKMIDKRKDIVITNIIFRQTSLLEARSLGLDQTDEYKKQVEDYERSKLFNAFVEKVIMPDVQLKPEEVRSYYDEHLEEYSSPTMLRLKSLVFTQRKDAESTLEKLRKGADFNWVSANVSGFVPPDTEGILSFDRNLLSLTSLPEDLQAEAGNMKQGETLLYVPPEEDYFYVLFVEDVFPPKPQPFMEVRDSVAKAVFNRRSDELIDDWAGKLKEVYDVKVFLWTPES